MPDSAKTIAAGESQAGPSASAPCGGAIVSQTPATIAMIARTQSGPVIANGASCRCDGSCAWPWPWCAVSWLCAVGAGVTRTGTGPAKNARNTIRNM